MGQKSGPEIGLGANFLKNNKKSNYSVIKMKFNQKEVLMGGMTIFKLTKFS